MTDRLEIVVSTYPAHSLVCLRGECDIITAQELRDTLADQARVDPRLILADMAGLEFIDAAGIHALLDAHTALVRKEKRLVLLSPQPIVGRVLNITGVDLLIPIRPGRELANGQKFRTGPDSIPGTGRAGTAR
jgi:anti-anti-sigma factor